MLGCFTIILTSILALLFVFLFALVSCRGFGRHVGCIIIYMPAPAARKRTIQMDSGSAQPDAFGRNAKPNFHLDQAALLSSILAPK
jgi:hypothetical protein